MRHRACIGTRLWLVEDGGNPAKLHAISKRGRRLASYAIDGISNTDWEDLAAFELDGKRYLLIADTGDNGGLRRTLLLHVVAEPAKLVDGATLTPAWSIAFRWPDGARDCEAVAVDAARGQILLLSKKRHPPELFALPLQPRAARPAGRGPGRPPRRRSAGRAPKSSASRRRVRASCTRSPPRMCRPMAARSPCMTYEHLLLYPRVGNGTLGTGRSGASPRSQDVPWLPQPEALGWAIDGRGLYATGEFSPAPLVYFPLPRSTGALIAAARR